MQNQDPLSFNPKRYEQNIDLPAGLGNFTELDIMIKIM
jgi:hypothetical protein